MALGYPQDPQFLAVRNKRELHGSVHAFNPSTQISLVFIVNSRSDKAMLKPHPNETETDNGYVK